MGSGLVVIGSLSGNGPAGLLPRLKPVLVQAFITEGCVKALDAGVLCWTARLDQDVLDTALLLPRRERPASELRADTLKGYKTAEMGSKNVSDFWSLRLKSRHLKTTASLHQLAIGYSEYPSRAVCFYQTTTKPTTGGWLKNWTTWR